MSIFKAQMNIRLQDVIIWPECESLQKTMPGCFQESFGEKVAIIVDCFEIFIKESSNLQAGTSTYMVQLQTQNTVKVLIGILPLGVVGFVSAAWGGRVSDKHVTEHWNFAKVGTWRHCTIRSWLCYS